MDDIRRISLGYPLATFNGTTWSVPAATSRIDGLFGRFRIEIGATWEVISGVATKTAAGTDVTTFRNAPTMIESLQFGEPYGETVGALTFPALTIFDNPAWLTPGANVDVWRVLPAAEAASAGRSEVAYWHGFVASVETADGPDVRDGVQVHLLGALFGEASLRAHQPLLIDDARDIGTILAQALYPQAYSRPLASYRFRFEATTTGLEVRHRGTRGQSVLDFCDEVLGIAQEGNVQWTISRAYGVGDYPQARKYYLREKSVDAGDSIEFQTIFAGAPGIEVSLTNDITEQSNVIYGEGIAADGSRWRNAKYPMLTPAAPAYPGTMSLGAVDASYSYDAVTALQYQLRAAGYPNVQITGTFDLPTMQALMVQQEDSGRPVDGNISGPADWSAVWSTGTGTTDISSGYFRPLSEVTEAQPYTFASNGAVTGDNAAYDGRLRVERVIAYGDRIDKERARLHARRLATQAITPAYSGSITLRADPAERSRLLIREGGFIRVNNALGSYRDFYIAEVQHGIEGEGMPTRLTVSERPFDLLDLSVRLERNRQSRENPARSFYAMRTRGQRPFRDAFGWDKESGAGIVQPQAVSLGWNVFKMVGAQYGTIDSVKAKITNNRAFVLALFGAEITATQIGSIIADPTAKEYDGYGWWRKPSNIDDLEGYGFIEAWGEFGERCGYYPGRQSAGNALTGKMLDDLGVSFASLEPPFLWVAVYVEGGTGTFDAEFRIIATEE